MSLKNLRPSEIQALAEQGIGGFEIDRAIKRSERIIKNRNPDGAKKYVPVTAQYAERNQLTPGKLKRLLERLGD